MAEELQASKITLVGEDGRRTVIEPGAITIEGGPQRGFLSLEVTDAWALIDLYTHDGSSSVKLKASLDGSGIAVVEGREASTLAPACLELSDIQRARLTDVGLVVANDSSPAA